MANCSPAVDTQTRLLNFTVKAVFCATISPSVWVHVCPPSACSMAVSREIYGRAGETLTELFELGETLVDAPSQLCPLGKLVLRAGLLELHLGRQQLCLEFALSGGGGAVEHLSVETPDLQSVSRRRRKSGRQYQLEQHGLADPCYKLSEKDECEDGEDEGHVVAKRDEDDCEPPCVRQANDT